MVFVNGWFNFFYTRCLSSNFVYFSFSSSRVLCLFSVVLTAKDAEVFAKLAKQSCLPDRQTLDCENLKCTAAA